MTIWDDIQFPTHDFGHRPAYFPGARRTLKTAFGWTPTKEFHFGGRRFIPLYPCVAFETRNFGFIIQKRWDGLTFARE